MKVFISWSGELSNNIALILKKYIPCIIQNIDVFCSSEDIEKGENWDGRLTSELANSCYGIICLTPSNINAAWINFEAGAIAKTLESRLTALMINLKPSDIQGPLKRYQATNLNETDVKKLIIDINKASDEPRETTILNESFEVFWPKINTAIDEVLRRFSNGDDVKKDIEKSSNETAIEEILQHVRKQSVVLSNLESSIPFEISNKTQYNKPITGESVKKLFYIFLNTTQVIDVLVHEDNLSKESLSVLFLVQNNLRRADRILKQIYPEYSEQLVGSSTNDALRKLHERSISNAFAHNTAEHQSSNDDEIAEENKQV